MTTNNSVVMIVNVLDEIHFSKFTFTYMYEKCIKRRELLDHLQVGAVRNFFPELTEEFVETVNDLIENGEEDKLEMIDEYVENHIGKMNGL